MKIRNDLNLYYKKKIWFSLFNIFWIIKDKTIKNPQELEIIPRFGNLSIIIWAVICICLNSVRFLKELNTKNE